VTSTFYEETPDQSVFPFFFLKKKKQAISCLFTEHLKFPHVHAQISDDSILLVTNHRSDKHSQEPKRSGLK
jgi:hypothetical protein